MGWTRGFHHGSDIADNLRRLVIVGLSLVIWTTLTSTPTIFGRQVPKYRRLVPSTKPPKAGDRQIVIGHPDNNGSSWARPKASMFRGSEAPRHQGLRVTINNSSGSSANVLPLSADSERSTLRILLPTLHHHRQAPRHQHSGAWKLRDTKV